MSRRKATRRPPLAHAAIEPLEPRAMLAGVGPESWSASGLAPAPPRHRISFFQRHHSHVFEPHARLV